MSARPVWVLVRGKDGKVDYVKRDARWVSSLGGLEWVIYRDMTKMKPLWYIVNVESGLSVVEAKTEKTARQQFEALMCHADIQKYRECIDLANKKYGGPPDRRITYI